MTMGDYITPDLHEVFGGWQELDTPAVGEAWAVEVEMGRPGRKFWTTVLVGGRPTVRRTLPEARRLRSYLRAYDKRTFTTPRPIRIVKITMSREVVQ
jgi:hypothetical protein